MPPLGNCIASKGGLADGAIRGLARAGRSLVSSELCCFMLLLHPASCCFMPLHPALRAPSATKGGSRDETHASGNYVV